MGMSASQVKLLAITARMNDTEFKSQQLDNEIKKSDTEHNALKNEFESVKSIIKDNVEKSFNIFG